MDGQTREECTGRWMDKGVAERLPPGARLSGPRVRQEGLLAPAAFLDLPAPLTLPGRVGTLTTAVTVPVAPGVGDLGAVGEDAPAVAGAPIALERLIVAVLVALGPERARVDGGNAADLFLALGQY